ncbi:MAG: TonB-dependent receptor [Cyclobacteriaceae bacterium]|nr:TonB-dependent receptor [Cyclobacteriaceae bacterium]
MRCFIFLLMLFLIAVNAHAQPCSLKLSGAVRSDDGEWLAGTVVRINAQLFTTADESGRFIVENLCRGTYTVTLQFVGYKTKVEEVHLEKDTTLHFVLETDRAVLEEVFVHDHFQPLPETGSYKVLSGEQLIRNRGMALGELMRQASGINTLQTGPSVFKPVINGLHSQRLLLINNGVRHESQQWGAEHAPEIDPFFASDIVVITDASALQYGPEALGGVVLVSPAPLPEEPGWGGEVQSVLQSNGRGGVLSWMAEGGSKKHKGLGWRSQMSYKRLGDFHTPRYVLSNTGVKELNFSVATGMHREDKGWDIFFSHFQTELGILKGTSISSLEDLKQAMNREPPQYSTGFTYDIQNPRQQVQHNLLKLQGHRHVNKGDLILQYAFQHNNRKEYDLRRQSLNKLPAMDMDLFTQTLDACWKQHGRGALWYQAGINLLQQSNNNVPGTQRIPFIPNYNQYGAGIFLSADLNLNTWFINGSLRYDHRFFNVSGFDFANRSYTDQFNLGNTAVSVGVRRDVNRYVRISSNFGTTWRPPHVSELYSMGVHQSVAAIEYGLLLDQTTSAVIPFGQYNFHPERSLKWTTSVSVQNKNWRTEGTVYINYLTNFTYLRPEGVTRNIRGVYPYLRYVQTQALFTGMDWQGEWRVNPTLSFTTRLSLIRAEDRKNKDYLIYIPPNQYAFIIAWKNPNESKRLRFYAETYLRFTDRQRRAPRVITVDEILNAYEHGTDPLQGSDKIFDFMPAPDAYVLLGAEAGVALQLNGNKMELRLRGDNLLNTAYRDYTDRLRYYALETGRNIVLSVRYSF